MALLMELVNYAKTVVESLQMFTLKCKTPFYIALSNGSCNSRLAKMYMPNRSALN